MIFTQLHLFQYNFDPAEKSVLFKSTCTEERIKLCKEWLGRVSQAPPTFTTAATNIIAVGSLQPGQYRHKIIERRLFLYLIYIQTFFIGLVPTNASPGTIPGNEADVSGSGKLLSINSVSVLHLTIVCLIFVDQ